MGANDMDERPVKVLLVEGREQDALWFCQAAKGMHGLEIVWHARDGEEALHYLSRTGVFSDPQKHPAPEVVVMDLDLPKVDGFAVLEYLWGRSGRVPIAIFSSWDDPDVRGRVDRLGGHLFEHK